MNIRNSKQLKSLLLTEKICVLECWWREEEGIAGGQEMFLLKVHQPQSFRRRFAWPRGRNVPFLSSGSGTTCRTKSLLPQLPSP